MDAAQKAAYEEKQKWVTRLQNIEARLARIEEALDLPTLPRSSQPSGTPRPSRVSTGLGWPNGTGEPPSGLPASAS